jgi:tetratricopeptide (TPR) repeat protein
MKQLDHARLTALLRQGKHAQAMEECEDFIAQHSESASGYATRASLHELQRNFTNALPDRDRVVRLEPNRATSYFNRGMTHYLTGNYPAAHQDFSQAMSFADPALDHAPRLFRADCNYRLNRHDEALSDCESIPEDYTFPGFRWRPDGSKHLIVADIRAARMSRLQPR